MPPDPTPDSPPPPTYFKDCCLEVLLPADAVAELVIDEDEIDPFTGDVCGWPAPIVYWSNGTITLGQDADLP